MQEVTSWLFWLLQLAADYGILVVYLWGLWCLMTPEGRLKDGKLEKTNYWMNQLGLAIGITLFSLSLYFRYTKHETLSMAADAGNAIFYWYFLLSKGLDIAESHREFRQVKNKGSLFHTVRHSLLFSYKVYKIRGTWYLVKWLVQLKRAAIILVGMQLSSTFMIALLFVGFIVFMGRRRMEAIARKRYLRTMLKGVQYPGKR